MGIKEAFRYRMRQEERLAKKENREPNTRLEKVPDNKRPTQESLEQLGRSVAQSIRQNNGGTQYTGDGR